MDNQEVMFPDIKELISHLKYLKGENLTPIRLQKALYFIFAFYGASYGQMNTDEMKAGSLEGTLEDAYPKYLFNEHFEAWKFGPVIPSVYRTFKTTTVEPKEWNASNPKEDNVKQLIGEVMDQLDEMGDFELVERTHEDVAWKTPYRESGQSTPMDNDTIINEYRTPLE